MMGTRRCAMTQSTHCQTDGKDTIALKLSHVVVDVLFPKNCAIECEPHNARRNCQHIQSLQFPYILNTRYIQTQHVLPGHTTKANKLIYKNKIWKPLGLKKNKKILL